jgi:nicotinamidase-related amidase
MEPYVTRGNIDVKSAGWLKKLEPYNKSSLKLDLGKSALMVIDMQKFFLDKKSPSYVCGGDAILPNIGALITAFRKVQRPVIFTRHVHHPDKIDAGIMAWWWEGMIIEGSPESEIADELAPLRNEKVILKHRYSAFYNTDLETILRCQKIEDIVITGIMTNMCCESTARDAYFRDYRVFFPADANGTVTEEMHASSLLNLAFGFASITTAGRLLQE